MNSTYRPMNSVYRPKFSLRFGTRSAQRAQALCRAYRPKFVDKWGAEHATADLFQRFHRGTPPKSKADYAYFLTGAVKTADGQLVACGQVTLGTGHADIALS